MIDIAEQEKYDMNEYEVMVETINPCGGSQHAIKEFIEVETDSPEAYVRQNGRFPIIDMSTDANGDVRITTGDGKGYFINYTFSE
jgi:hypothetical protein